LKLITKIKLKVSFCNFLRKSFSVKKKKKEEEERIKILEAKEVEDQIVIVFTEAKNEVY
jgi:hypothetical protein